MKYYERPQYQNQNIMPRRFYLYGYALFDASASCVTNTSGYLKYLWIFKESYISTFISECSASADESIY